MRKKKIIYLVMFFLAIFFILNINTTRSIGINYKVMEYKIPIYLKVMDFYNRHYNYKYLVNNINNKIYDKKNIILNTTKWIKDNIKKTPEGVDTIDYHPLTIVQRRLGKGDQFNDLLSVLLVYANVDSFYYLSSNNISHSLTFFKIDNYWSIIDPYYGIYFVNNEGLFASVEDIKNSEWEVFTLESKKINLSNIKEVFGNKFNDYDEVKNFYDKLFYNLPSSNDIDNTYIFDRGGRSYTQDPLGRIRYEIHNMIKLKH